METDKIHLLSIEMKTGTGKWQTLSQDLIFNLCNNFEVLSIDLCGSTDHPVLEGGKTKKKLTGAGIGAKF